MSTGNSRPRRPRRVQLAVPGSSDKMMAKAAQSRADHVFLDLEDAVAEGAKEKPRYPRPRKSRQDHDGDYKTGRDPFKQEQVTERRHPDVLTAQPDEVASDDVPPTEHEYL